MKNKFIILILLLFYLTVGYSQNNVGIGTITPDSNAILEMQATDKGILIPRMSSIQRNNMSSSLLPTQKGLLVFDNDSTNFFFWNGYMWQSIGCGAMGPQGPPGTCDVQLYGVNSTHVASTLTTYTLIPDLTQTITLTDTAKLDIHTTGGFHTGIYVFGPSIYVSIFCNNTILPYSSQYYVLADGGWSIASIHTFPPGTYTFDVRAHTTIGYGATVGYSPESQSSLIIRVYY